MKAIIIISTFLFLSCTSFAQKKKSIPKTDTLGYNYDTVKIKMLVVDTSQKFIHEFTIKGYGIKKQTGEVADITKYFLSYLDENKKRLKKSIIIEKTAEIEW